MLPTLSPDPRDSPQASDAGAMPRERILSAVRRSPGIHLREAARRTGMPLGTVVYHMGRLVDSGALGIRRDGGFTRFFVADAGGAREREVISVLRHGVALAIARSLLDSPGATQAALALVLGAGRSTVSETLARMEAAGVVEWRAGLSERTYRVVESQGTAEAVGRLTDLPVPPAYLAAIPQERVAA